ncbi:MAG: aminotransferase class V-fold PLP-dependent enzyme [Sphaerochaetaceae bacterium]
MEKTDFRQDFPLLQKIGVGGLPIAYFDNAATSQKPHQVINAVTTYYESFTANTHRGSYALSALATKAYEATRTLVAHFIGALDPKEIVFTFGTTDSINQVAQGYAEQVVQEGDEILISVAEHHSNLLPWQRLATRTKSKLRYLLVDQMGTVTPQELASKLTSRTKIVAITHISNVLGGINPIKHLTAMAHKVGAVVLVDAAQSASHIPLNVVDLDVDFMAFSAHKMYGPTGVGVLYAKKEFLEQMEPTRVGGGIVEEVTQQHVRFLDAPLKFEAGTQNIEGVIGLGAAIDYVSQVGLKTIYAKEQHLTDYVWQQLSGVPHIHLYGSAQAESRSGILSFTIEDVHPHDVATILDAQGVAIRAGHHCAQPLMAYLGVNATCRASLCFYNTEEEIRRLAQALSLVREVMGLGPT